MSDYEIVGLVSDRGKTRIYQAVERTTGQHVALRKVDITDNSTSAELELLIQMTERLKTRPHPNLATVLELIHEPDALVIVYEWVEGQSLREKVMSGISLEETLVFVQATHAALHHLHEIDVVHGHITPDNVLINAQNQMILINVANYLTTPSSYRMSDEMMGLNSPELLQGGNPDRNSDLYSLGVILFRILGGDYPWKSEDGVPRTRGKTDTVPRLPEGLQKFQSVIEGLTAFNPKSRSLEKRTLDLTVHGKINLRSGVAPQIFRPQHVSFDEVHRVSPIKESVPIRRSDVRSLQSQRTRTIGFIGLCCVLVSALLWWLYSERDGVQLLLSQIGLIEHPELAERWRDAEALRADINQSLSAVTTAYDRVLALSPEHGGAQQAIVETRSDWKKQIAAAVESDQLNLAQSRIIDYLNMYADDSEVQVLQRQVERRLRIGRLFDDTRMLTSAGVHDQASAIRAIESYQEIQRRDPESEEARVASNELNLIVEEWLRHANEALENNDITYARQALSIVARADPTSRELELARNEIETAESLQEEIDATLLFSEQHVSNGRLIEPPQDNAYWGYRQVLELDPNNTEATLAMDKIETQILVQHGTMLQDREFDLAWRLVSIAEQEQLSEDTVESMRSNYETTKEQIELAEQYYHEALALYEKGYLSKPRSRNAMSLLIQARELDAKNTEVSELVILCAHRLAAVAMDASAAGMTEEALEYINHAILLQPDRTLWQDYRTTLSENITSQIE